MAGPGSARWGSYCARGGRIIRLHRTSIPAGAPRTARGGSTHSAHGVWPPQDAVPAVSNPSAAGFALSLAAPPQRASVRLVADAMNTMAPLMAALPAVAPRQGRSTPAAASLGSRSALRGAPMLDCARGCAAASSRGVVQVVAVRALAVSLGRPHPGLCAAGRVTVRRCFCLTRPVCLQSREVGVGLMGNKAGMTSYFTGTGAQVPVTVIALLPGNVVTQARGPHAAPKPPGTQLLRQDAAGTRPACGSVQSGAPGWGCAARRPAGCEPRRPSTGQSVPSCRAALASDLQLTASRSAGEDARDGRLQRRPGGLQPDLRRQD